MSIINAHGHQSRVKRVNFATPIFRATPCRVFVTCYTILFDFTQGSIFHDSVLRGKSLLQVDRVTRLLWNRSLLRPTRAQNPAQNRMCKDKDFHLPDFDFVFGTKPQNLTLISIARVNTATDASVDWYSRADLNSCSTT